MSTLNPKYNVNHPEELKSDLDLGSTDTTPHINPKYNMPVTEDKIPSSVFPDVYSDQAGNTSYDPTAYVSSIPGVPNNQPAPKTIRNTVILDPVAKDIESNYRVQGYSDKEVHDVLKEFDSMSSGEFEQQFEKDARAVEQMYTELFTNFTSQDDMMAWLAVNAYQGADDEWKLKPSANVPVQYKAAFRRYYLRGVLLKEYDKRKAVRTKTYQEAFADYNSKDPTYVNSIRDVVWNVANRKNGNVFNNLREWANNVIGKPLKANSGSALTINIFEGMVEDADTLGRLFKSTGTAILPFLNTNPPEYYNFRNPDSKDYFQSTIDPKEQRKMLQNDTVDDYLKFRFETNGSGLYKTKIGEVVKNVEGYMLTKKLDELKRTDPHTYALMMQYADEADNHLSAYDSRLRLEEALTSNEAIDFTTGNWVKDLALEMTHDPTFVIGGVVGLGKSAIKKNLKEIAAKEIAEKTGATVSKQMERNINAMLRDALPGSELQHRLWKELHRFPTKINTFKMSDDSIKTVTKDFIDKFDDKTVADMFDGDLTNVEKYRTSLRQTTENTLRDFRTTRAYDLYRVTRGIQAISDTMDMLMIAPTAVVPYTLYKLTKSINAARMVDKAVKEGVDAKYAKKRKANGRVVQMSYAVHEYAPITTHLKDTSACYVFDIGGNEYASELLDQINDGFANDLNDFKKGVKDILEKPEVDLTTAAKDGQVPVTMHLSTSNIEEKLEALNAFTRLHTDGAYQTFSDYDSYIQTLLEDQVSVQARQSYVWDRGFADRMTPIYNEVKEMRKRVEDASIESTKAKLAHQQAVNLNNIIQEAINETTDVTRKMEKLQAKIDGLRKTKADRMRYEDTVLQKLWAIPKNETGEMLRLRDKIRRRKIERARSIAATWMRMLAIADANGEFLLIRKAYGFAGPEKITDPEVFKVLSRNMIQRNNPNAKIDPEFQKILDYQYAMLARPKGDIDGEIAKLERAKTVIPPARLTEPVRKELLNLRMRAVDPDIVKFIDDLSDDEWIVDRVTKPKQAKDLIQKKAQEVIQADLPVKPVSKRSEYTTEVLEHLISAKDKMTSRFRTEVIESNLWTKAVPDRLNDLVKILNDTDLDYLAVMIDDVRENIELAREVVGNKMTPAQVDRLYSEFTSASAVIELAWRQLDKLDDVSNKVSEPKSFAQAQAAAKAADSVTPVYYKDVETGEVKRAGSFPEVESVTVETWLPEARVALEQAKEACDETIAQFVKCENKFKVGPGTRLMQLKVHNSAVMLGFLNNPAIRSFVDGVLNATEGEFYRIRQLAMRKQAMMNDQISDDVYSYITSLNHEQVAQILQSDNLSELMLDSNSEVVGLPLIFNSNDPLVIKQMVQTVYQDIYKTDLAQAAYGVYEMCERLNHLGKAIDKLKASGLSELASDTVTDKIMSYFNIRSTKLRDPNGKTMAQFVNDVKQSMYSQTADRKSSLGGFMVELLDYQASRKFWENVYSDEPGADKEKLGRALYDKYEPMLRELKEKAHKNPEADEAIQELFVRIRTPELAYRYDKDAEQGVARYLADFETNGTNFEGQSIITQYAWRLWTKMPRSVYDDSGALLDTYFSAKYQAKVKMDHVKVNYPDGMLEADDEILGLNYPDEPDVEKRVANFRRDYMNPNNPEFTYEALVEKFLKDVMKRPDVYQERKVVFHNNNNFDAIALTSCLHKAKKTATTPTTKWNYKTGGPEKYFEEISIYKEWFGVSDEEDWSFIQLYDNLFGTNRLENSLEMSKPMAAQLGPKHEMALRQIIAELANALPGKFSAMNPGLLRRSIKQYQRVANLENALSPLALRKFTDVEVGKRTSQELSGQYDPIQQMPEQVEAASINDELNGVLDQINMMKVENDVFRGEYIEDPFYKLASDEDALERFSACSAASPERNEALRKAIEDSDQDAVDFYMHFVVRDEMERILKAAHPEMKPGQLSRLVDEQLGPFNNIYRPLTGNSVKAHYGFQSVFDWDKLSRYFDFSGLREMTASQIWQAKALYRIFEKAVSKFKGDLALLYPYQADLHNVLKDIQDVVRSKAMSSTYKDEKVAVVAYLKLPPETDTLTTLAMAQYLAPLVPKYDRTMEVGGIKTVLESNEMKDILTKYPGEIATILSEMGTPSAYSIWDKPLEILMKDDFETARFLHNLQKPMVGLDAVAAFFNRNGKIFFEHIKLGAALTKMENLFTELRATSADVRANYVKANQGSYARRAERQTDQILHRIMSSDNIAGALEQHLIWNLGVMTFPLSYKNANATLLKRFLANDKDARFVQFEWNGQYCIMLPHGSTFLGTRAQDELTPGFYSRLQIRRGERIAREYDPPVYDAIGPETDVYLKTISDPKVKARAVAYHTDMVKRLDVLTNGRSRGSIGESLTKKAVINFFESLPEPIRDKVIDMNIILDDAYFGHTRFNMSFLGPYKTRFRAFYQRPPLSMANDFYALQSAINYADAKIKYVGGWFDMAQGLGISKVHAFPTKVPSATRCWQLLHYLNVHNDYCLVSQIPSAKHTSGYELVKQDPKNITQIKKLLMADKRGEIRTILVPRTIYEQSFTAINRDAFSSSFMKAVAWLTHATKVGMLATVGATFRNLTAGAYNMLEASPNDQFIYRFGQHFLASCKELAQYNAIVRELAKEYAGKGMSLNNIDQMIDGLSKREGRMTTEQFMVVMGMQNALGTESDILRTLVQPHNDMNSMRRALVDEQGRNIIAPARDITVLPFEQIEALCEKYATEIDRLDTGMSREEFLSIVQDKQYIWNELPPSKRILPETDPERYVTQESIMADSPKYEEYGEEYAGRLSEVNRRFNIIKQFLTSQIVRSQVPLSERIRNTYGKVASTLLSPMSSVEHVLRTTQYRLMEEAGYAPSQILSHVTRTMFNYNLKSNAMQRAELLMPFAFFEKNNVEFWAWMLTANPQALREFIQVEGETGWDFDNYDVQDIAFNYSVQSRMLAGGLPISPQGLYLKINPPIFNALEWMTNAPRSLFDKLQIPIRQVFLDNMELYGSVVNNLFDESITWSANPENSILNDPLGLLKSIFTPNAIPLLGPAWMRYTQMLPTYMKRYATQSGLTPEEMMRDPQAFALLFATVFGIELQKPGYVQFSNFLQYQAYLKDQGYAYDNNTNKVVPIGDLSSGGLNDFPGFLPDLPENKEENRRRFEELKRLQYGEGKVWDANINKFVYLADLTLGGLNRQYQDEEGNWLPGGWAQLCADKWTYNRKVWDANQRSFVKSYERIPGGLNQPHLTWDEYKYYTQVYFGEVWDANKGRFVLPEDYSGDVGLNQANLTWSDVQYYKRILFHEEWDSNLHQWVPEGTSTGNNSGWHNYNSGYYGGYRSTRMIIASAMPKSSRKTYKAGTSKPLRPTTGYGRPQMAPILSARDAVFSLTASDMHNMIKFDFQGYADYVRGTTPRQRLQNMRQTWSMYH